jgi:hypothetical protein
MGNKFGLMVFGFIAGVLLGEAALGAGGKVDASRGEVSFSPDWTLRLSGSRVVTLTGLDSELRGDALTIALLSAQAASVLHDAPERRALVSLERGEQEWPLPSIGTPTIPSTIMRSGIEPPGIPAVPIAVSTTVETNHDGLMPFAGRAKNPGWARSIHPLRVGAWIAHSFLKCLDSVPDGCHALGAPEGLGFFFDFRLFFFFFFRFFFRCFLFHRSFLFSGFFHVWWYNDSSRTINLLFDVRLISESALTASVCSEMVFSSEQGFAKSSGTQDDGVLFRRLFQNLNIACLIDIKISFRADGFKIGFSIRQSHSNTSFRSYL